MKQNKVPQPATKHLAGLICKRIAIYTLILLLLLVLVYILDRFILYAFMETIYEDGKGSSYSYSMRVPFDALAIFFIFIWLIGSTIISWQSWAKVARFGTALLMRVENKEQLQKTILRRYKNQFIGSALIFTLVLGLIAPMVFLIGKSRTWYDTDPFFQVLKFFKDLSPFAGVALWVGGVAYLLYRQWRQSAADVVGLIGSIEQMQTQQDKLAISVPSGLPEVALIIQDIYDKGQMNRRIAKESEQRKNELIAYLAHDLRTPLTSIIGYLSLLVEQPDMPMEKKAEYCRIILDKAMRLENLIGQFFEISRYNMNEMVLEKKQLDLKYLLFQLSDEFYPFIQSQGKSITLNAPDDVWVEGDADKLARVFNNIIRNAVVYGYPNSPIEISVIQNDAYVVVSIGNCGRTIPPEQCKNIFNKFFRLDDARSGDTGGSGLGLAIAREIVLLHGGNIEAQSEDERVVLTVSLPKNKN